MVEQQICSFGDAATVNPTTGTICQVSITWDSLKREASLPLLYRRYSDSGVFGVNVTLENKKAMVIQLVGFKAEYLYGVAQHRECHLSPSAKFPMTMDVWPLDCSTGRPNMSLDSTWQCACFNLGTMPLKHEKIRVSVNATLQMKQGSIPETFVLIVTPICFYHESFFQALPVLDALEK